MSFAACISILLIGLACIVNSTAVLKVNEEVDEINEQIGYMFDWLAEENRKIDKLDAIIQRIEKE